MHKKSSKKEALLQAAKELFGECGYTETTFKKISDRAGVALGLLTHHYGSKEKIFLASGLDVLENFYIHLQNAIKNCENGFCGVLQFCRAYLEFSIDPDSCWLVLVRCSPYSDMKTKKDKDLMYSRFVKIHNLLERQISRGMEDGSVFAESAYESAQVIISLLVGVNRTMVLTPYVKGPFYEDALNFVARAIRPQVSVRKA